MAIYLVDYENTHYLGGISGLSANDTVVVFYTQNSSSLSFDAHKEILQAQAKILYKYVDNGGKNALDFQLSTYLGCLIGEKQADEQQLYIVSKDKGFYYVSKFWEHEKGIRVTVVPSLTEQPKAKQQQSAREETQTATIGQIVAATVVEQGETAETVGNAAEETTAVESEIANVETEVATTIGNATDSTAATEESAATNDGTAENADDIAEENQTKNIEAQTTVNATANCAENHIDVENNVPRQPAQKTKQRQRRNDKRKNNVKTTEEPQPTVESALADSGIQLGVGEIREIAQIVNKYKATNTVNNHINKLLKDSAKAGGVLKIVKPFMKKQAK